MLVISRNTAFTYQVDTKQIGRELYVSYVLEGSLRRSGNRVRVNAQLIDAEADMHLWAERFDGDTSDLFALQDEITSRIAIMLNLELVSAEAARPTGHPDAQDYILRGRGVRLKARSQENSTEAIGLFEQALALDQQSVVARLGKRQLVSVSARLAWDFFTRSQVEPASQCYQLHALMPSAPVQPGRVSKHALTFIHNGRRTVPSFKIGIAAM